jgi:DNA helicase-2/ATP-dependent DNA helicase PcrA
VISADRIADALGRPRPTAQQRAVIEADLTPALVVAGAGSGKTETMANRVLWLLANGHVSAGEVLGLTFTRKAAGELGTRIRSRIAELAAAGIEAGYDAFDPPTVSTYNSFANTIFRDNAVQLGRESDGAVLSDASAWQLARRVVVRSPHPRLPALGRVVDTLTRDVLTLSHALSENIADPERIVSMAERFARLADLPAGGRGAYGLVDELVAKVGALPVLLELVEQFEEAKRVRGLVEYSDQVAFALDVARRVPAVAAEARRQYRVVLLDEYQDTSVVQTWLLAELFAGTPVMAVGDPNQSIYGWRGASAANLAGFPDQFGAGRVQEFALSTSWRNGHHVLAVANAVIEPLAAATSVPVPRLEASPIATDVPVAITMEETVADEADAVARWLKTTIDGWIGGPPTASMLFRARKTQDVFIAALRRHDVPFHVLGVGGLLGEPEIADLVSALTVIDDPGAGSELVRLLAGSRWRIGVRDLDALREVASWLSRRDYALRPLDDELRALLRSSVNDDETSSIVDALDFVATARPGHTALAGFSETGLDRLRDAGLALARLRGRSGLELLDLVTVVQQDFLLDIEVLANESRLLGTATTDAFFDALAGYLAIDESASLGGFLSWLREAEWRDDLMPRPEEPEAGTVQLMTIHGAKGLEHDIVVVPRLVDGELPATPKEGYTGWLSHGRLPYEFRGDARELPVLAWETATTRKELAAEVDSFKAAVRSHHELEERRLAYVAVTRARHALLLSGSFWASQTRKRSLSSFFAPLVESGLLGPVAEDSAFEENPYGTEPERLEWPMDPLGLRRPDVERAAEAVREAQAVALRADPVLVAEGGWARSIDLLLEERRRRLDDRGTVDLPDRVPASRFKDYLVDPAGVAASLRRPMPERPYAATRLGTLFHTWVEERYGMSGTTEIIDAVSIELDADADDVPVDQDELERLQRIFERSPWASLRPVEVEREIHLPLGGQIVVCKIDAVYAVGDRFQVVDWKTGKAPRDADDLEQKQLQLALYRLAYARWRGIDPDRIDAVFYYVSDDRTIVPQRLFDEEELVARWSAAIGRG